MYKVLAVTLTSWIVNIFTGGYDALQAAVMRVHTFQKQ